MYYVYVIMEVSQKSGHLFILRDFERKGVCQHILTPMYCSSGRFKIYC
jgi:predicted acetyltransferase